MNKMMAILFLLGAIGCLGLSQRDHFETQSQTWTGAPVGKVRTVNIGQGDKVGYLVLGAACMVACLYFVAQIRRDDLGK